MITRVNEMNEVELRGIDGSNFLGFLATLGVLVLVTKLNESSGQNGQDPLLRWAWAGTWYPVLLTAESAEGLAPALAEAIIPEPGKSKGGQQRRRRGPPGEGKPGISV